MIMRSGLFVYEVKESWSIANQKRSLEEDEERFGRGRNSRALGLNLSFLPGLS